MQTQIKSQIQQDENIPIKLCQDEQEKQQNHPIELNQQDRVQSSSIPVYEKTKLPIDSNIYLNNNHIPVFQQVPYQQSIVVAQQIYSEVNQVQQSSAQQTDNQQFMNPQSMPYQPGSGIPTHKNLIQVPKMRYSQYLQCKWCNQEVFSQIEHQIGLTQLLLCLLLSPALGIGLIFLCCDTCKDCYSILARDLSSYNSCQKNNKSIKLIEKQIEMTKMFQYNFYKLEYLENQLLQLNYAVQLKTFIIQPNLFIMSDKILILYFQWKILFTNSILICDKILFKPITIFQKMYLYNLNENHKLSLVQHFCTNCASEMGVVKLIDFQC